VNIDFNEDEPECLRRGAEHDLFRCPAVKAVEFNEDG
jgi:hypothetical protein